MNSLPYLTGVAALVTILASIVLFTFSQWRDFFASHFGAAQLRLVAGDSNGDVCILNTGSRAVFVHYVVFENTNSKWKTFFPINQLLPPGELLTKYAKDAAPGYLPKYRPVRGASAYLWKENIWKPKLRYVWFTEDHPVLQGLLDLDQTEITAPGTARVIYFAASDYSKQSLKTPCTALLVEVPDDSGNYVNPPEEALSKVPPEYAEPGAKSRGE
jgi:hypothetical protein